MLANAAATPSPPAGAPQAERTAPGPMVARGEIVAAVIGTASPPARCAVCGRDLPPSRGHRPRVYCSEPCAEFAKFWSAAHERLGRIVDAGFTVAAASRLRGELLRAANLIPSRWERPRGAGGRWARAPR